MSARLLVTGAARSGTTLLERLLSAHPSVEVFSQPLPLLYVEVKRAFLLSRSRDSDLAAIPDRYPLNDMFGCHYYPSVEFQSFLHTYGLEYELCRRVLVEMLSFSGQRTRAPDTRRVLQAWRPAPLLSFVDRYLQTLGPSADLTFVGSKELYCEEYVPYLLDRGVKVLQIIRDPRDVLVSLNMGTATRYTGLPKPILFNIRQWRKSVAFALAHLHHPDFLAVRYEDLVHEPDRVLGRVAVFLGLPAFPGDTLRRPLRSAGRGWWKSNSSHSPSLHVTARSVGVYRRLLAKQMENFVRGACAWELERLGYLPSLEEHDALRALESIPDEGPLCRPELSPYVDSAERCEEEQRRFRGLREGSFEASLHLLEGAFSELVDGSNLSSGGL